MPGAQLIGISAGIINIYPPFLSPLLSRSDSGIAFVKMDLLGIVICLEGKPVSVIS